MASATSGALVSTVTLLLLLTKSFAISCTVVPQSKKLRQDSLTDAGFGNLRFGSGMVGDSRRHFLAPTVPDTDRAAMSAFK